MSAISIDSTLITRLRTDISDIFSVNISLIKEKHAVRAVRWVQTQIDGRGFALSTYLTNLWISRYYMLYEAAFWMLCEILSNLGILSYKPGEVTEEQLGRLRLQYSSTQPKFFFFGKTVQTINYERLITHETFRMIAASYIDMFYYDYRRGSIRKYGAVMQSGTDPDSSYLWE